MAIESNIFDNRPEASNAVEGFYDFKLLKTTANASLYIAFKAGKRFLIKTTNDNSERELKMLNREYELSIGCDHPHLLHIYTIEESFPFGRGVVMEYIEGRTLGEYLAEGPSKKELNRIFDELLSAVGYLHKRGIIHNDIKPENILITRADNTLKLIDFGLADSDAEYAMRTLGCTPHYASPELQAQSHTIDARSDIYSIGVVMREIFGNSSIATRCTKINPKDRFANVEALQRTRRGRHQAYFIAISALALIFIFSLIFIPIIHLSNGSSEEDSRKQLIEQCCTDIEKRITAIYKETVDSVKQSRYLEFAIMQTAIMQNRSYKYARQIISALNDPVAECAIQLRYGTKFQEYFNSVLEIIKNDSLPSFRSETPVEHHHFYDSLYINRLPYRPYPSKDNERQQ